MSDALGDELGALAVTVEDADADSDAEQAIFGEPDLPAVGRLRLSRDQSVVVEILHDPAEIAGIETQLGADLLGREILTVGEFVQHPGFAQRERALQELLVQHTELAGVETIEGADRRDFLFGNQLGHGTS